MELRQLQEKENTAALWRIAAAIAIAVLYVLVGSSFGPGNQAQPGPAVTATLAQGSR
jgi:anti-sigma-K factor RskA